MKAISVRQPWAFAIIHLGKDVENREWRYPPKYRGPLLVHAAKGCTREEYESAALTMAMNRFAAPRATGEKLPVRGGIIGRVELVDARPTTRMGHSLGRGATCALCGWKPPARNESPAAREYYEAVAPHCPNENRWGIPGQLGIILAKAESLLFIPWKGELGVFEVDEKALAVALEAARRVQGVGASHA